MGLPDGVDPATVKIVGQTQRIRRSTCVDYPELWDRTLQMQRERLAQRVVRENLVAIGDLHVDLHYSKRAELTERPDWAAGIDPPWYEEVECTEDDPDCDTVMVMMEVACAPR